MKMRHGNFVFTPNPRYRLVGGVFWVLTLALIFLVTWLWFDANEMKRRTVKLETHKIELRAQLVSLETNVETSTPSASDMQNLADDVEYFNRLSGPRAASVLAVLTLLEEIIPEDVWIQQLSYSVETGLLSFGLLSDQETALPPVLNALENIEGFADVILERQIRLQGNQSGLVQYDIRARVE